MEQELTGKTILFVNSGSRKKAFTFEIAKELGLDIVLLNQSQTWQKKYLKDFIKADTYNHEECIEKVRNYLKDHKVDGAITFWEDDVPLLAKICETFGLIGPSIETAIRARNKYEMRKALQEHGVRMPKFMLLNSKDDLKTAIETVGFPAVLKPCWGSDSEFVLRVENEEEATNAYEYVSKNATPRFNPIFTYNKSLFVYEEYVEGRESSVECLTQKGETSVISIMDKMPMQEPFFMERGDYMPTNYEADARRKIREVVIEVHKAIGIKNSVSHTEIKMAKEGPIVIEIASRLGGDYICDWVKNIWGVNLVAESLKIALAISINAKIPQKPQMYLAGKYFIPEKSGVVSIIKGINEIKDKAELHDLYFNKKIGDTVLVPPEGFENIGWIVAKGDSAVEAEKNLNELFADVEVNINTFNPASSFGQTKRKNPFSSAILTRKSLLTRAKIEKIRTITPDQIGKLRVGILCNIYQSNGNGNNKKEAQDGSSVVPTEVEKDLMDVGVNIQKALEEKGHEVTFFDMNENPPPFKKLTKSKVDIVFNVCERINDSSLLEPDAAALLDILQIPYTGSNPASLALCIDKIRMKKLLAFHAIPTPKWDYVYDMDEEIDETLRYPLIVKPANTDNSIGITNDSVVTNKEELMRELKKIIVDTGRPALIEEYIEGDEYDVSIIGNEHDCEVLPLSRSIFDELPPGVWGIYPFEAKWGTDENSIYKKIKVERPAKIPARLARLITEIALDTYNILDCHDYGRIELRVDKEGNPYVIELNPNPSINKGDCVPASAELIGLSYSDFIEQILIYAIKRYKDRPPYYHLRTTSIL